MSSYNKLERKDSIGDKVKKLVRKVSRKQSIEEQKDNTIEQYHKQCLLEDTYEAKRAEVQVAIDALNVYMKSIMPPQ
jgi:triphosphoribosyl-dephospho-CoA synthetase